MDLKRAIHRRLVRSVSFLERTPQNKLGNLFVTRTNKRVSSDGMTRISISYEDILSEHDLAFEDALEELVPLPVAVHRTNGIDFLPDGGVPGTVVRRGRAWSCHDGRRKTQDPPANTARRLLERSNSMKQLRSSADSRTRIQTANDTVDEVKESESESSSLNKSLPVDPEDSKQKQKNGQGRCLALYTRHKTPHYCCATKKSDEGSLRPSAWTFGKLNSSRQLSPRQDGRKDHYFRKDNGKRSTLSKTSSNSSNWSLSDSATNAVPAYDASPSEQRLSTQCSNNGQTVSNKPSALPRPIKSPRFRVPRPKSVPLKLSTNSSSDASLKHSASAIEGRVGDSLTLSDMRLASPNASTLSLDTNTSVILTRENSELPVADDSDNYPEPNPPVTKKVDIFNPRDFILVDQRALQAPEDVAHDLEGLLLDLLDSLHTDIAKLRSIFRWLVSQRPAPTYERPRNITPNSPLELLHQIWDGRGTYADLLSVLCRKAEIPCVVVQGVAKGVAYDVGDKLSFKKSKNSWNAVYVDNAWRLIHPYWASHVADGYQTGRWAITDCDDFNTDDDTDQRQEPAHIVNDFYFLTDPDQFITKCLPDDPSWQLLAKPISKMEFEELPFLQPAFYDLKLKLKSHTKCVLHTEEGTIEITLEMPVDKAKRYNFKYKLFMKRDNEAEGEYNHVRLSGFLLHYSKDTLVVVQIRFPLPGVYKLQLFCTDSKKTMQSNWICDYKIVCSKPMHNCQPLPIIPAIGWGPGIELETLGLEALTHKYGMINLDKEYTTFIRFAMPKDTEISIEAELLKTGLTRDELESHVTIEEDGDHVVVQITPPCEGEFALRVFVVDTDQEGKKQRKNVCNYLMHRTQIVEDPALADIRNELVKATDEGDVESLALWIERFMERNMEDRGDLTRAKKQQSVAKLNRDIREAIDRKDLDMLERTMQSLSDTSIKNRLGKLANEAEAMRSRLRRLKRLQHQVLALDQKTISELRSYPKPPPPVHGVMAATFMLLGNSESDVKKWSKIQGLISKKGRMALKRRVAEFNIDTVEPVLLKRVQTILSKYDLESVQIASVGAATFYEWTHSMAGELES